MDWWFRSIKKDMSFETFHCFEMSEREGELDNTATEDIELLKVASQQIMCFK